MLRFSEAISPILRTFGARDVSLLRSLCRFENITASEKINIYFDIFMFRFSEACEVLQILRLRRR